MINLRRYRCLAVFLPVTVVMLSGCSWNPTVLEDRPASAQRVPNSTATPAGETGQVTGLPKNETSDSVGAHVATTAESMLGVPYVYGGNTPRGFDCSGLVQYAYQEAGMTVPRTTAQQLDASSRIDWRNARAGDLLFFRTRWKVSHVAIYLGDGQFVHAPSTGSNVSLGTMENPYYRSHLVRAGRLY